MMAGVDWKSVPDGQPINNQRFSRSSHHSATRSHPMGKLMMKLTFWLILCLVQKTLVVEAHGRERRIICPSIIRIAPCTCSVEPVTNPGNGGISTELVIVCREAEEMEVLKALHVLRHEKSPIYWMTIHKCNLPQLRNNIFQGLRVRQLSIIHCNVSSFEESSLSALGNTLETLDLSDNNIQEVPTTALSSLKALKSLVLNSNQIQVLNEGQFMGLSALEKLYFFSNKIHHIHHNAFQGIERSLLTLNLGGNILSSIPSNSLQPLTNLQGLHFYNNHIANLTDIALKGLHKLERLTLKQNRIISIPDDFFKDQTLVRKLDFKNNEIVSISSGAFAGLENSLEKLELGHNKFDHIPAAALRPLRNLRRLDFDTNLINVVKVDDFKGYGDVIEELYLHHNHIKSIPTGAFDSLHSLQKLKLSYNDIQFLNEETMNPVLDTLTIIDIANNPLRCGCELLWFWQWLRNPDGKERSTAYYRKPTCITQDNQETHIIQKITDNLMCSMVTGTNEASRLCTTSSMLWTIFFVIISQMWP